MVVPALQAQQQQINALGGLASVAATKAARDTQREDLEVAQRARDIAAERMPLVRPERRSNRDLPRAAARTAPRPEPAQRRNSGTDLVTAAHAYRHDLEEDTRRARAAEAEEHLAEINGALKSTRW